MDNSLGEIKIVQGHFEASTPSLDSPQTETSSSSQLRVDHLLRSDSHIFSRRKLRRVAHMLNFFSLRGLPWGSSGDSEEKVELSATELESLRSEIADLEEREAHLNARLEHIDGILRTAHLSGYLYIRMRWAALPGEPPPIDDAEVDDWVPRFVVLSGPCIFFFFMSTDISPQDSTLLSDITEVGRMPNLTREDEEMRYCFYILTHQGLRFECSSISKAQVDSWLSAIQSDCKSGSDTKVPNGLPDM